MQLNLVVNKQNIEIYAGESETMAKMVLPAKDYISLQNPHPAKHFPTKF